MTYQEMQGMKCGRTRIVLKKLEQFLLMHYIRLLTGTPSYVSQDRIVPLVKRISDTLICYNGF